MFDQRSLSSAPTLGSPCKAVPWTEGIGLLRQQHTHLVGSRLRSKANRLSVKATTQEGVGLGICLDLRDAAADQRAEVMDFKDACCVRN